MTESVVHFMLRLPPALHERLADRASRERASLNALLVHLLDEASSPDGGDPTGAPVPLGGPPDGGSAAAGASR